MILMVVFFLGNTLTAVTPNLFLLFVSRIITAGVAGAIISLILVYVSIIAPIEKRSMMVATVFAGFSTATIIGVPLGTTISSAFSWHVSFAVISGLALIIDAFLLVLVPRHTPQTKGSIGHQVKLLRDRRIILGIVVMVTLMAAEYTFYTYIRPIITDVLHFSTTDLNWLLGLVGVMFIIGNACAGIISSRYGIRKLPLISGACLALLLLMGLSFANSWTGVGLLCLICLVLGMPGSILQVMFLNVADKDYPAAINLASSLNPICTNVGVTVGSFLASLSVNFIAISQIGYVGAVLAVISTIGAVLLVRHD